MMKILFDCERMKYPNTGLYHFCLNLGNTLKISLADDERLDFLVPKKIGTVFGEDQYYKFLNLINKIPLLVSGKYRFLGAVNVDVWHMTYQTAYYMPMNRSTKIVLTIHDLNFLYEHPDNDRKRRKYLKIIQNRIDRADHVVCISNYCKSDVEKYLDLRGKKVSVIYNGCSFHEGQSVMPKDHRQGAFLYSIGTILPKKNFHVLPPLLENNNRNLIISGVGADSYKNKILEEARKYGVHDRVFFTGAITEAEKSWYLKNCEAFVFPSVAEGFGLPVLEAMYYGKPVFLSTLTSLPEVGGPHAYYFDNFDAEIMRQNLATGLSHYANNQSAAEAISNWAKQFSWEKCASNYIEIYRDVTS